MCPYPGSSAAASKAGPETRMSARRWSNSASKASFNNKLPPQVRRPRIVLTSFAGAPARFGNLFRCTKRLKASMNEGLLIRSQATEELLIDLEEQMKSENWGEEERLLRVERAIVSTNLQCFKIVIVLVS
jgi:hypothetical protein